MLLGAYAATPATLSSNGSVLLRMCCAVALMVAALVLATRSVTHADYPMFRAFETLTAVVGLLVVGFASVYLATASSDPAAFSEPLDHVGALYFALTTATTIGFGDITPRSHPARIVVMVQMVANVLLIGVATRLLLGTAKRRSRMVN